MKKLITDIVEKNFSCKVLSVSVIGNGASSSVYKVELYSLYNELLWYKTLGKIGAGYLIFRSKRLLKILEKII